MADSVAQLFSKVQPDGSILYDFDGHVHARGLDLDAGDAGAPPNDRRIRWSRTSDGVVIFEIFAYAAGGPQQAEIKVTDDGGALAELILVADDAADANTSAAVALSRAGNNISRLLLDKGGRSNYAQLPPGTIGNVVVMGGRCDGRAVPGPVQVLSSTPAGAIAGINRTGAGTYTLTHTAVPGGLSFGTAMPQGFAAMGGTFSPLSATTCQVRLQDAAGVFVDDLFTVLLIG